MRTIELKISDRLICHFPDIVERMIAKSVECFSIAEYATFIRRKCINHKEREV